MALSNSSKSIRVYFDDDEAEIRIRFKQLAARAETPMSRRAADLIKLDIAYWEVTGEILDLSQLDVVIEKLSNQENGDNKEANGHHTPQQVKVVKPTDEEDKWNDDAPGDDKEDHDIEVWNPNGPMKVEVAYPKRRHKAYKGRVGEMIGEIDEEERVVVRFSDGDEEVFLDEELEIASQ